MAVVITIDRCFNATEARADDTLKLPPVKKVILKNGMTILLIERPRVPIVSFNFIIKAVRMRSGRERGVASLTAEMMRKGTKIVTQLKISNELDFIGGELGETLQLITREVLPIC